MLFLIFKAAETNKYTVNVTEKLHSSSLINYFDENSYFNAFTRIGSIFDY